jgi:para-aminobenzoate synthetase / 4-amino-4-deoxychorismate lyase
MPHPVQVVFWQYRHGAPPVRLVFDGLISVVEAWRPEEVLPKLVEVEQAVGSGLYAAGFLSYEASSGMDRACRTHPGGKLPLVWFGLFRKMFSGEASPEDRPGDFSVGPWQPSIGLAEYQQAVDRIKEYIASGDTYQVNYSFRLRAAFAGDSWSYFQRLCRAQRGQYAAYIDTGRHVLCSASPELFFSLDGTELLTRPMKGTAPRGLTSQADRRRREELARSVKDRAENAMIVDMMRNDVGRVAERGSMRVLSSFDLEKYPTVLQMTSTVAAQTSAPMTEILRALFPPASITGAPKIRTMEIIREMEPDPRGVYTGTIGWLAPGRKAEFNVAIRTVAIDRETGQAEYGVGGGIVWDSEKAGEYAECETKAAVLTAEAPEFELLETMRCEGNGRFYLLEEHLQRLRDSAEYFDFAVNIEEVQKRLEELANELTGVPHRVRLRVGRYGQISLDAASMPPSRSEPWRLRLAERPMNSRNPFLYHKTTHRDVYEAAHASRGDCDDVVLWNEQGQVTETRIANLVVEKDGCLVTPPVECGLLPGVFRKHLLETGQIVEGIVTEDELRHAERVFAINSVRGWMPAVAQL